MSVSVSLVGSDLGLGPNNISFSDMFVNNTTVVNKWGLDRFNFPITDGSAASRLLYLPSNQRLSLFKDYAKNNTAPGLQFQTPSGNEANSTISISGSPVIEINVKTYGSFRLVMWTTTTAGALEDFIADDTISYNSVGGDSYTIGGGATNSWMSWEVSSSTQHMLTGVLAFNFLALMNTEIKISLSSAAASPRPDAYHPDEGDQEVVNGDDNYWNTLTINKT